MTKTIIKPVCFILMLVGFTTYLARLPAFPLASANLLPWSVWFFVFALANMILWQRVMKLLSFCLLVIWIYTFAANIVPQSSTASVDVSSIERTPEAFIEAGEAIFNGKGKCRTCHTLGPSATKGRCPDLEGVGARAATRKPGVSAKGYLIESLYDPTAFLVTGYGKIMPPVWKAPISLSNLEIETVIAFLQSQGGEVDMTPFTPPVVTDTATEVEALPPILTGDPERGKNVFVNVAKCIACHDVAGVEKPTGQTLEGVETVTAPNLTEIAALNSLRYIEESILKPNAEIVSGYGSATVQVGGAPVQGTLVSQDNEKIVLRVKGGGGQEEERTISLSELTPEPIAELVDLKKKGYFWMQVTPVDATDSISGELVNEDAESMTLKVASETKKVSKSNVKAKVSVTTFDDDEPIVGELVSENEEKITLNVNGTQRTINQFDVDTKAYSRAFGKRIAVKSPMPENFPQLLTVAEFNDLLAFLSTLKGEATGAIASTAEGATTSEATATAPAE